MNNIDELERHLDLLNEVLNSDNESDANEDELYERRIEVRRRMVPFYRQRADIFDLFDDNQIYKVFRFDKASIWYIEGLISNKLGRKLFGRRCLLPIEQILVSLQFYANGTFQSTVGNVLKISQPSVSRCVRDVSNALCEISSDHIFFPANLLEIQRGFTEIANLRGVVGSVDGTHIRIARPHHDEEIYVNRKGYHSINVQGICDAECNFLSVSASKPGSSHDSNVFADSVIGRAFKNNEFGQSYLLGDSGYACTPFLLTPYSQPEGRAEERFNTAHKNTRNTIERIFGTVKRRFHCLHGEIRLQPGRTCRVIMACCVLHNIARKRNQPDFDEGVEEGEVFEIRMPPENNDVNENVNQEKLRLRREGFAKRQRITLNQFTY
uniref:Putative nuclease HARBI1 n=1 Tax=Daphnia galeata TaxID=27404 RepID=A0A8J2RYD1_9CRUS|nr:unnamed protein product [Daphnia galeata]